MSCSVALNAPLPSYAAPIGSKLTANMVKACTARANDGSIPQNTIERVVIDGVPVVLITNCHDRHAGETQASGSYHGCSVWIDTAPITQPQGGPMVGEATDWGMVFLGAGAIAAVTAGFFYVLRGVESPRVRRAL